MATLYNDIYDEDTSEYALRLINTPISEDKQTSIYLGDFNTKIYTKNPSRISFGANVDIDENLTIANLSNPKKLTVYGSTSTNVENPYANITSHIRQSAVSSPASFLSSDILLLEGNSGSFLQLLSDATSTSGIGFSNSTRNKASISYNHTNSTLTFTSDSVTPSSMTFVNNTLTATNISATTINSTNVNVTNLTSKINLLEVTNATPLGSTVSADFTNTSVVVVKGMITTTSYTINLTIPSITTSPHRMRIVYLLVKSNGNYTINRNPNGLNVRFPSDLGTGSPVSPSPNDKYDMYSFISNGQDAFCTFAYNYSYNNSGVLF